MIKRAIRTFQDIDDKSAAAKLDNARQGSKSESINLLLFLGEVLEIMVSANDRAKYSSRSDRILFGT